MHEITSKQVLEQLRDSGFRMTKTRRALVELFLSTHMPLHVPGILASLAEADLTLHKTTLYREIEFLLEQGVIVEVRLDSKRQYYECAYDAHHHHIRCVECGEVKDVKGAEKLHSVERSIEKESGFKVVDHSLEFVGLCPQCQK